MDAHSKQVETLKTLFQKLWDYSLEFVNLIMMSTFYHHGTTEPNPTASAYEMIGEKLDDFWAIFIQNRSLLSEDIAEKIHWIYSWVKFLHKSAYENLPNSKGNENNIYLHSLKYELFHYHTYTNEYSKEEWDRLTYAEILKLLIKDMTGLVGEMRDLYEAESE